MTPTGMLGLAGVTDMEDRVAEVTVRVVLPEIVPEVAVMVAVPAATAVARPLLLTVATDVLDELQVTCVVISRLVPSEYVPEAVNCWVTPTGMLGLAGVTDMEDRVAEVTVRVVLPEITPGGGRDGCSTCGNGCGQAAAVNRCDRCIGRAPGDLRGYIRACPVRICAGGCKLLGISRPRVRSDWRVLQIWKIRLPRSP